MKSFFRSAIVASVFAGPLSAATYFESVQGDLSDDYVAPTAIILGTGSNRLVGSLAGGEADLDLFTLQVLAGSSITAINILGYTGGGNGSFLGLQFGSELSQNPTPSDEFFAPIGYAIITAADAAATRNVLGTITVGPPFFGAATLPAGTYAGWLNETGAASTYDIEVVVTTVPEPSALMLIAVAGAATAARRRRR